MSNHPNYEIPTELNNLLIDFTVSVLVNRPNDLLDYAANYFNHLVDERRNSQQSTATTTNHSLHSNHLNDDDNDSTSSEISMFFGLLFIFLIYFILLFVVYSFIVCTHTEPPARLSFTRRKSVFAEHYDPEEDEGDNEQVINDLIEKVIYLILMDFFSSALIS